MRILHLITTLGVGGAEKHLLWLAQGQIARGHDLFVTFLKGEGELSADFTNAGVPVRYVELTSPGVLHPLAPCRAVESVADLLDEWQPDILHTHLLKADGVGALAARRAGFDAVVSSKHNDERALLRKPFSIVHGLLAKRMQRTIALSDHVARFTAQYGRVPVERIRRVYYGVEPAGLAATHARREVRARLGIAEDVPLLVCVGRMAPQKDHPTLLAALAQLPREVELLLVGGDPFGDGEQRLQAVVDDLALGGQVHFLGIRHDVPDLLAASDLFVLPSLWEGLGLVFLEAMAVGLPIVASNVSAVPEVVDDGRTGWLVPPADPAALAAAIQAALDDPDERRRRGVAGRERLLERFALARMIEETEGVYEEVVRAAAQGHEERETMQ